MNDVLVVSPKNEFRRKHRTETPFNMSDMNTLSNVETGRGQAKPPSVRLAPETIPEAKSSNTWVSVRYIPEKKQKLVRFSSFLW